MKKYYLIVLLLLASSSAMGQATTRRVRSGSSLPATCNSGTASVEVFILKAGGASDGEYYCSSSNIWTRDAPAATAPGGSTTQLQRNNAGAFGGISGATSDGTNTTFGSGNMTATRPKFITSVDDINGAPVFEIGATASSVNRLKLTNSAAGVGPEISATGSDTNIPLRFTPKGSGISYNSGPVGGIGTTCSAPALTFSNWTNSGIRHVGSGVLGLCVSGADDFRFHNTGMSIKNGMILGWGSFAAAQNVGIGRSADGVLEVNDGTTAGTFRDLRLRTPKIGSTTARPTCDSTTRGDLYHFYGGAGVKDTVDVCAKAADDSYAWRTIY